MKYESVFSPVDPASAVNDIQFEKDFTTLPHSSYEWERIYATFVAAGDVVGARRHVQDLFRNKKMIRVGNLSRSELNQARYLAVSLITVVTRVAINHGADELKCYQTSDEFIQFLDTCEDPAVISARAFASAEIMIQAVRDAKQISENNLYIKHCREYIFNHLGEKITVSSLAEICGLTPNYLSSLFKQLSGKTITDYILEQRIQVAKRLLLDEKNSIVEIAVFLGFSSQSYFISCFRKQTGETPRRWKMHHNAETGIKLY